MGGIDAQAAMQPTHFVLCFGTSTLLCPVGAYVLAYYVGHRHFSDMYIQIKWTYHMMCSVLSVNQGNQWKSGENN